MISNGGKSRGVRNEFNLSRANAVLSTPNVALKPGGPRR